MHTGPQYLDMSEQQPFSKSRHFERAVAWILRPLVRALIAQGVTAPALYRIVKRTYVEVAEQELDGKATDSRISVATGVHRRDVKALREESAAGDEGIGKKVSTLATVVGRWLSDPDLTGDDGAPLPLLRSADAAPSFDHLVQRVSRDIRPRTVLDELIRQGIATRDEDMIVLHPEAIVGPADLTQKLHFFSRNLGDHMNASVENLLSDDPPFIERAVFYNNLTPAAVTEIEAKARALGGDALLELNSLAARHQDADRSAPEAHHRFRFGVFFYQENEGGPDDPERDQT